MTCPDCRDRLQQWLDSRSDGAASAPGEPPTLCPACAEWAAAARRLDRGLRLLVPPAPPAYLAERVVALVAADRRRRRYRLLFAASAAAVAALLLLAAWQAFFHADPLAPAPSPDPSAVAQRPAPSADAPPDAPGRATLHDSVAAAGSAMASLTSRTADETVERTRMLWPVVEPPLGKFDLQPPLEPPTHSLQEAGQGVSAGLEPVADSARRAVGLFLRELPPMDAPKGGL
jgi:hypothetical protein